MAIRQINATDSLETLRSQFNTLAAQDFGDIANLDSSISSTSIVGAMNELITFVSAAEGFFVVVLMNLWMIMRMMMKMMMN